MTTFFAPASSRACLGWTNSDSSKKSVARMATRTPCSSGTFSSLCFLCNLLGSGPRWECLPVKSGQRLFHSCSCFRLARAQVCLSKVELHFANQGGLCLRFWSSARQLDCAFQSFNGSGVLAAGEFHKSKGVEHSRIFGGQPPCP